MRRRLPAPDASGVPRQTRMLLVPAMWVGLLAASASASAEPRLLASPSRFDALVAGEINAVRRAHGLVPVRFSAELSVTAEEHSLELLEGATSGTSRRMGLRPASGSPASTDRRATASRCLTA